MRIVPFAAVAEFWSPDAMRIHLVPMVLAVIIGTLFDVSRKRSGVNFANRREKSRREARRRVDGGEAFALALPTTAKAAVSGEFQRKITC